SLPDAHRDIALYNACVVRSRQTDAASTRWQTRNPAKLAGVIRRTQNGGKLCKVEWRFYASMVEILSCVTIRCQTQSPELFSSNSRGLAFAAPICTSGAAR